MMSKTDDQELPKLTKPQQAADAELAALFPEWEYDQRQCIATIVADAVTTAIRLEALQAQPRKYPDDGLKEPIHEFRNLAVEAIKESFTAMTASPPVADDKSESDKIGAWVRARMSAAIAPAGQPTLTTQQWLDIATPGKLTYQQVIDMTTWASPSGMSQILRFLRQIGVITR